MVMNRVSLSRAKKILRIPDPVSIFDLYPDGRRGLFFRCLIFRTAEQMGRELRYRGHKSAHNVSACVIGTEAGKESLEHWGHRRCIGIIVFTVRSAANAATRAHEIFHATHWWARQMRFHARTSVTASHPTHERLAEANGRMAGMFCREYL